MRSLHRLQPHARRVQKVPQRAAHLDACRHPPCSPEVHQNNSCFAVPSPPTPFSWQWDTDTSAPHMMSLWLGQVAFPGHLSPSLQSEVAGWYWASTVAHLSANVLFFSWKHISAKANCVQLCTLLAKTCRPPGTPRHRPWRYFGKWVWVIPGLTLPHPMSCQRSTLLLGRGQPSCVSPPSKHSISSPTSPQPPVSPINTSFRSRMFFWGSWAAELPESIVLSMSPGSAFLPSPGPDGGVTTAITSLPSSGWVVSSSSRISKSPLGPLLIGTSSSLSRTVVTSPGSIWEKGQGGARGQEPRHDSCLQQLRRVQRKDITAPMTGWPSQQGTWGITLECRFPMPLEWMVILQQATQPHILMVTKRLRPLWLSWTILVCHHTRCPQDAQTLTCSL